MMSIFDEEEAIGYRRARQTLPLLAPVVQEKGYIMPSNSERLTYVLKNNKRKRTVWEALERLGDVSPPYGVIEALPPGLQRIARKPMFIYTAAWWLAAGAVIVDPLNRLEGGLID
jgi:hypothetical protein